MVIEGSLVEPKLKKIGRPAVILYATCNIIVKQFDPRFNGGSEVVEGECFLNESPFQSVEGFFEINEKEQAGDVLFLCVVNHAVN